ncbi:MAG: phosphatidylserine decarboxylase [Pseudomonadota bacterium]
MNDTGDLSGKRFPWARSGFDLEGYVGALAAWLVGILLSILWSPLFWIGFIAAIIILFATRTAERTVPERDDALVAPCDGIVVSVGGAAAPDELRLGGTGWTRVRLSAGPMATNGLYAPIAGEVDHIIRETGDPGAFYAGKPDKPGLVVAYISFVSDDRSSGYRVATGGLGPRLEIASEAGDAVRTGRNIGTMRLGGWCDLYVPSGAVVDIAPGQTVIGGETIIAHFDVTHSVQDDRPVLESESSETDDIDDILESDTDTSPSEIDEADDVNEMFERLRSEARKAQDD